ncbi:MAG: hypothetical protein M0R16_01020 [Bacteroidales bacterium]|jgi:hypothetical protein|nr:hypothetical protein [Bacteroidales bacterium]
MKHIFSFLLIGIIAGFFYSCTCNRNDEENKKEVVLKDTTVQITINRYEKSLFNLDKSKLQEELLRIQPEYSFFLNGDLSDPGNIRQIKEYLNDLQMIENYNTCQKNFPELSSLEKQLSAVFTIFKSHFPEKKIPRVYTYICGMDIENPVIYSDSVLVIALDMYLGPGYKLYQELGLPLYIRKFMSEEYIVRDCIEAITEYHFYKEMKDASCLDYMIYEGRKLYFIDALLPAADDSIKVKYSQKQLEWCYENEARMWAFFIDNNLLYSKDLSSFRKFFTPGPFTTAFAKKSPARVGSWIGWQIIREYMKQNKKLTLKQLFEKDNSQEILQASGYKPKKLS